MGCPQGSVPGPALWNVLLDDLLWLPFPAGVKTVAYADDVTVLVEASSRAEIERLSAQALGLILYWGRRNRLAFAPAKSCTMTVKGRLQRPPIIRMGGDSIRTVSAVTVLGLVLDEHLSFAQHAQSIGERASKSFGKVSRVSAASWGVRYPSLKTIYLATYLTTLTYAAGCWYKRANLHVVRSALLKTAASYDVVDQSLQDREHGGSAGSSRSAACSHGGDHSGQDCQRARGANCARS
ncbi:Retrovirus-related Pol polyprotein from type-1 retrotransposable element R1 [Eumeta japonica]|uniref:Retrovirus-related Pol polyprotein from type-1 retrotransposable element R1 n=1 Tax=Eumeta variegata TaxID=151549 RepID=A0A4C1ZPR2_EUMVA|nr:Retrovirus-related Pol polyprotein from type-1 retrotransposable element R1 [Eumeta japonica]